MNARQSNKRAMYREVQVFLATTMATRALAALPAKTATLNALLTRIDDLVETQTRPLVGVLRARDQATNAAIDLALAIAGPVRSYAVSGQRPELAALVDLARRDFLRIRRGERTRLAQRVLDAAQPLATELDAYGVTPAMLAELHARIEASNTAVDVPRTTAANKKTATAALATVFHAVDTLLKDEIDPMLAVLGTTDPDALARYRIGREVINRPGTRSDPVAQPPNAATLVASASPTAPVTSGNKVPACEPTTTPAASFQTPPRPPHQEINPLVAPLRTTDSDSDALQPQSASLAFQRYRPVLPNPLLLGPG